MPGEGGDCGTAYRDPNVGEETEVGTVLARLAAAVPRQPVAGHSCFAWLCGTGREHGLLLWQRGPGLPAPKGSRVAFLPCFQLVSSFEV